MHLDEGGHPPLGRGSAQLGELRLRQRRHDEQHGIRPQPARLGHLVGIDGEVLAQQRPRGEHLRAVKSSALPPKKVVSVSTLMQSAWRS